MTGIPAPMASAMAGFSASGLFGLTMIAFTFAAIRFRMSVSWPAASTSWWIALTPETLPDDAASALTEQRADSRQPLPVPPPLAYPIEYLPAAPPDAPAEAPPDAPAEAPPDAAPLAPPPAVEQADATTAMAARPIASLPRNECLSIRTPPLDRRDIASRHCGDRPRTRGARECVIPFPPPARPSPVHRPLLR